MRGFLAKLLSGFLMFVGVADAAVVTLDSFMDGAFVLGSAGENTETSPISSPIASTRTLYSIGFPTWTSTFGGVEGTFSYTVDQIEIAPGRNFIDIYYTHDSGSLSILGYDAVAFHIAEFSGEGFLRVSGTTGGWPLDLPRIPITGPGILQVPVDILGAVDVEHLPFLGFEITAMSEDFSITLDQITLVPEPSATLLGTIGGMGLLLRRRRASMLNSRWTLRDDPIKRANAGGKRGAAPLDSLRSWMFVARAVSSSALVGGNGCSITFDLIRYRICEA